MTEVDITPKVTCSSCSVEFPKDNLHFPRKGAGFLKTCHECVYAGKIKDGDQPKLIPVNGKPKSEWAKYVDPSAPVKPDPWIRPPPRKEIGHSVSESFTVNSEAKPSTPSPPPPLPQTSRAYQLPELKKTKEGGLVLFLDNYLTIHADGALVNVKQERVAPMPRVKKQEVEEATEEEMAEIPPDYGAPNIEDVRAALLEIVWTHKNFALLMGLNVEIVQDMAPDEVYRHFNIMSKLKNCNANILFAHLGVTQLCYGIESFTFGRPKLREWANLDGYGEAVAADPDIADTIGELVSEYSEELSQIGPLERLGGLLVAKGMEVNFLNRGKERARCRQEQEQQDDMPPISSQ